MKNLPLKLFAITLLAGFFYACNETLVEEQPVNDLELKSAQNGLQTYIVVLDDAGLDAELSNLEGYEKRKAAALKAASNVLNRAGIIDGQIVHAYGTAIKGFSVKIPPGELKKLENDPSVKLIEKNQVLTLIEPKDVKIYEAEAQYADSVPWGIKRVFKPVEGGVSEYNKTAVAWIIDTGIDLDHPDLIVDESRGYSAFTRGPDKSPDDGNGHGTHVAGTVAAIINNGTGVVGVAPGATVIPVKVLGSRASGSYDNIIAGVDYVAANGSPGDVANMSLGGVVSDALDEAVFNASETGIKFTLSAGNNSEDANNHSPARVNGTNIYTLSAMDSADNFANFSNYGNPPVDFCQPGVSVYSTYKDGQYATMSGTSMAAPHMAGILLWGTQGTDGTVKGDPDGNADAIAVVAGGGTTTNNPPTADFTFTTTNLTADFTDQSTDSDGTIVSHSWNFGDGSTSTAMNPSHTYAAIGTYTVTLTVTDDEGATHNASQDVSVSGNTSNNPPTADAGPDQSLTDSDESGDESVTLDGSDSTDPDGDNLTFSWSLDGSEIGTGETYLHTFAIGSHTITLTVSDGEFTHSDDVRITVSESAGSDAPTIDEVTVSDNSNPAWTRVAVSWSVSDANSDLRSVTTELFDPSGNFVDSATTSVSGSSASGTDELGQKGGASGVYSVIVTVTDVAGNITSESYTK